MIENSAKTHKIHSVIDAFINRSDVRIPIDLLCAALPPGADLYLIGGAIRNLIIQALFGTGPPIEDIDLFVANIDPAFNLSNVFSGRHVIETELGGIRWSPESSGFSFDICLLPNFLIIQKYHLDPTLHNFLLTIDFTVNAVVFDIKRHILHEKNCINSICRRVIGFNTDLIFDKILLAYRVLEIRHKIDFVLSENAFKFIRSVLDVDALIQLKAILISKLGKEKARAILEDYDRISRYHDYGDYLHHEP